MDVDRRTAQRHHRGPVGHHAGGRTVPRRTRRLANHPALPLRLAGARSPCPRGGQAALRAFRYRREAHGVRRRHHRPAARHRRHRPGCGHLRLRTRRDRAAGHHGGQLVGAVRLAVPGMRGAGAAAPPPPPRQALPAVAPAPACRPTARRRAQLPGLPHRAGSRSRMPAGRLRRADADRPDVPHRATPRAPAGGGDADPVPVRRVAAVRLRRRLHVRRRQPPRRTACRRARAGPHSAGRAARPGRVAGAARRRRHRQHHPPAPTPHRRADGPRRRGRGRPSADAGSAHGRGDRRALHRRRRRRLVGRATERQAAGHCRLRGSHVVGIGGGHRAVARRRRGGGAGGRACRLPRTCDGPAGRATVPIRPHPWTFHDGRGGDALRPRGTGGRRRAGPTGRRRKARARRVHRRAR